jgi:hypothetical protein
VLILCDDTNQFFVRIITRSVSFACALPESTLQQEALFQASHTLVSKAAPVTSVRKRKRSSHLGTGFGNPFGIASTVSTTGVRTYLPMHSAPGLSPLTLTSQSASALKLSRKYKVSEASTMESMSAGFILGETLM